MRYEEVYRDIAARILREAKSQNAMFKLLCEMSEAAVEESMKIRREREPEKEINMENLIEEIAASRPKPQKEPEIVVDDSQQLKII